MVSVHFDEKVVAPTAVTYDGRGHCKLTVKLPITYRAAKMIGILDHEIGTHFLRKHND